MRFLFFLFFLLFRLRSVTPQAAINNAMFIFGCLRDSGVLPMKLYLVNAERHFENVARISLFNYHL